MYIYIYIFVYVYARNTLITQFMVFEAGYVRNSGIYPQAVPHYVQTHPLLPFNAPLGGDWLEEIQICMNADFIATRSCFAKKITN